MSLDKLDKETVQTLAAEMLAALRIVGEKYGVDVRLGGGNYNPSTGEFNPRLRVKLRSVGGVDPEEAAFKAHAKSWDFIGLKPEDYGRKLTLTDGGEYTLTECGRRGKYAFRAKRDGASYKFTYQAIERAIGVVCPRCSATKHDGACKD